MELRAIIDDTDRVRIEMMQEQALYKGDYAFTDHIFSICHSRCLNTEFIRIRHYQLTRWLQKSVVIAHKVRDSSGENHRTLFQEEYDTMEQAEQRIPQDCIKISSFSRRGWEYESNNMRIFVEEIDTLPPSIEIIADTQQEILNIFNRLEIVEIVNDSVPAWYSRSLA